MQPFNQLAVNNQLVVNDIVL